MSNAKVVNLDAVRGFHSSCGVRHSVWGRTGHSWKFHRALELERARQRPLFSWAVVVTQSISHSSDV